MNKGRRNNQREQDLDWMWDLTISRMRLDLDRIYNETVALIRLPPDGVTTLEICAPENFRLGKFTREACMLAEGYEQGRAMAGEAMAKWERGRE